MVANQEAVTVEQNGEEVVIKGDLSALHSFASSNPAQGEHKWVGIDIKTNIIPITDGTWNGSALTQDDIDEAAGLGLGKGHIVYWAKADVLNSTPASIAISDGEETLNLTVSFENTGL